MNQHWFQRKRSVFSTNHRTIGLLYLILALVSVTIGSLLSLLMRIHLVCPDWPLPFHGPILPEDYLALEIGRASCRERV